MKNLIFMISGHTIVATNEKIAMSIYRELIAR